MKFKHGDMCIIVSTSNGPMSAPDWIGRQVLGRVVVLSQFELCDQGCYWSMDEPLTIFLHEPFQGRNPGLCSVQIHEDNLRLIKRGDLDMQHDEWLQAYEAEEERTAKDLQFAIDKVSKR